MCLQVNHHMKCRGRIQTGLHLHAEVKASTNGRFYRMVNREEKKKPAADEGNTEPTETDNLQDKQQADEDDTATENPGGM